jgi:hypothetical protein
MFNIEPKFVPGTMELYFASFFHMDCNTKQVKAIICNAKKGQLDV